MHRITATCEPGVGQLEKTLLEAHEKALDLQCKFYSVDSGT